MTSFFKLFGHTCVSISLKLWGSIVTEVSYGEFNPSIILEPSLSPILSGTGSCLSRYPDGKFLSDIEEIWAFRVRCLFCNFSDKQCCLPSNPNALLQNDAKTTEVLRIQNFLVQTSPAFCVSWYFNLSLNNPDVLPGNLRSHRKISNNPTLCVY